MQNADLAETLGDSSLPTLVDDVGGWLTAELDAAAAWNRPRGSITEHTDRLCTAVEHYTGRLVLVSLEVGLGIVPESASGRLFRDELGALNQQLARVCDEVFLVAAGLPLQLK